MLKDKLNKDINLADSQISQLTRQEFKMLIKTEMRKFTFSDLDNIKAGHPKGTDILHCDLKTLQGDLTNTIFSNKQSGLLFNLKSQCVNEFKSKFYTRLLPNLFKTYTQSPMH